MFAGRVIEKRKGKVKQIMGEWNLGEETEEIKVKKEQRKVAKLSKTRAVREEPH